MEKISVTCTECGKKLKLPDNGKPAMKFKCPGCGIYNLWNRPSEKPKSSLESGTITTDDLESYRIGKIVCNGGEYPLALGINTIGRNAEGSTATIQLFLSDKYISRKQAKVEVKRLPDQTVQVILSKWESDNPIFVNGQKLSAGDRVMLTDGDVIQMGLTQMFYRVQKN